MYSNRGSGVRSWRSAVPRSWCGPALLSMLPQQRTKWEGSVNTEWSFIRAVTHRTASLRSLRMLPYTHKFMSTEVTRVDKHTALWKYEGKKQALRAHMQTLLLLFAVRQVCMHTHVCVLYPLLFTFYKRAVIWNNEYFWSQLLLFFAQPIRNCAQIT